MGASQVAQWWRIRLPSRRHRFKPWVGKIPWKKWQPCLGSLPGESHGQRSLVGHSPWGLEESDTTEWLSSSKWGSEVGGEKKGRSVTDKVADYRQWRVPHFCHFTPVRNAWLTSTHCARLQPKFTFSLLGPLTRPTLYSARIAGTFYRTRLFRLPS